jgi:uncharacterized membrane protein
MRSSLQKWHVGKIGMLWGWGVVLMLVAADYLAKQQNPSLGFLLIGIFVGIPLVLSVVTWRWLSGKEKP